MKCFWMLLMIVGLSTSQKKAFNPNIRRVIKIACNATGVICTEIFCRFKTVSRTESLSDFGCGKFNGPMIPMLFSLTMAIKADSRQNFRHIMQVKHVDACFVLSNPDKFPIMKKAMQSFEKGMPGIIQKCPYKELKIMNATFGFGFGVMEDPQWTIFPNGIYKMTLEIADGKEKPKNTASINVFYEKRIYTRNFEDTV